MAKLDQVDLVEKDGRGDETRRKHAGEREPENRIAQDLRACPMPRREPALGPVAGTWHSLGPYEHIDRRETDEENGGSRKKPGLPPAYKWRECNEDEGEQRLARLVAEARD